MLGACGPGEMRLVGVVAACALSVLLVASPSFAASDGEPAPPYPPRERPRAPAVRYYYPYPPPPPPVVAPPPLSPVMRAIYAPFYAAGLVVRYGVYYVLVLPLEVFGRTVTYGAQGGVPAPPPPPRSGGGT